MIAKPRTTTPAQARVVDEVLAWGEPRPQLPDGLVERLLQPLSGAVADWIALRERRPELAARPLLITKTRLSRLVCDGLQRDPEPYVHAWANVRGTLVHAAIESDLDGAQGDTPAAVVDAAWHRLATDRPGDPASIGSWLNAREGSEREAMVEDAIRLLAGFREVWPALGDAPLRVRPEHRLVAMLGGRAVRMQGVPDIVVDSEVDDGRARRLIVDLKTGMPRGQQDRDELRFYALLAALSGENVPFRWATLYVTEGRLEHEDLSEAVLLATARRVADAIAQAVRMADSSAGGDDELRAGGRWCRGCRRRDVCEDAVTLPDGG
jgi:hypothetical protein